jgi:putative transposase
MAQSLSKSLIPVVHKKWAELSNRYHVCNDCKFEIERDKGSVMVMYNVATKGQQGLGTSLSDVGLLSSTSLTVQRKHTGSMKQLGKVKRQKSQQVISDVGNPNFGDSKLG